MEFSIAEGLDDEQEHSIRELSALTRLRGTEMVRVMDWIAVRAHNQDQFDYDAWELGNRIRGFPEAEKRKLQLTGLELLKAVTESSGMTQAELAKLLDIEQGTVSKIMSGARSITLDHAKRLARRFKMRPEAFLDLE